MDIRNVGFIGLGIMGRPMALNLVKAGFKVSGFSRTEATRRSFSAAGGRAAANIRDVTQDADVVITMLPDTPDVLSVAHGPDGVFASARPGLLHIDMSTISPKAAVELAEQGNARGIRVLDAPVSGGEVGAKEATLSIMVGGAETVFEQARPVLTALGTTIVHVGPNGAGQTVKAANQLIVAGTIELVAEAIVFLEATGVEIESALDVIGGGLAGSRVLDRKGAAMRKRDFKPGFRVDLHHKDLGIVLSAARDAGVVVPVTAVVAELMASLRANGEGSLDHSALLKGVERLAGRLNP